jgi:hypothetical protein
MKMTVLPNVRAHQHASETHITIHYGKLVIPIWTAHGRPTKSKLVFMRQKLGFHTFAE